LVVGRGRRADLILVDQELRGRPRVVAALVQGRIVHLGEAERMVA
jgi:alpha-D-ribose 1-methylphosphonate 5-triphosphate diphosphatase